MNLENSVVIQGLKPCKPISNAPRVISTPNNIGIRSERRISSPNDLTKTAKAVIDSPNNITEVVKATIEAPNVLSANAYSDLPPFPETHGRILYDNKLFNATINTSGGSAIGAVIPNTFQGWIEPSPKVTHYIDFSFGSNIDIDTLCFGGHTLGGKSISYRWRYKATSGGSFVDITSNKLVTSNAPVMDIFNQVSAAVVRLEISNPSLNDFQIMVVSGGESLQLQRPLYGGVAPSPLNAVTDYFNNRSESGEWIGRTIRRKGFKSSVNLVRLTPDWYRQYFQPFVESAKELPFFYAWRPGDFPDDVSYCWTDSDFAPSNSGQREFMSVSFAVNCHGY